MNPAIWLKKLLLPQRYWIPNKRVIEVKVFDINDGSGYRLNIIMGCI